MEAKANKAIEKHEDPIEMLDLSITKKEKLLQDAKKQCANFIASVDNIRNEKKSLEEKIEKYEQATKAALLKEDNEKAQGFVKQKLEMQDKLNQTIARIESQDKKYKKSNSK
ncbi:PspA/IM30 family protein [Paraclostridium sp. AKS81]|nr:PspA/IM30 family protein [Paraclostridium sp. AKS81]